MAQSRDTGQNEIGLAVLYEPFEGIANISLSILPTESPFHMLTNTVLLLPFTESVLFPIILGAGEPIKIGMKPHIVVCKDYKHNFKGQEALDRHCGSTGHRYLFKCRDCKGDFKSQKARLQHCDSTKHKLFFECKECIRGFESKEAFDQHCSFTTHKQRCDNRGQNSLCQRRTLPIRHKWSSCPVLPNRILLGSIESSIWLRCYK